jgi:hypothetical protein
LAEFFTAPSRNINLIDKLELCKDLGATILSRWAFLRTKILRFSYVEEENKADDDTFYVHFTINII